MIVCFWTADRTLEIADKTKNIADKRAGIADKYLFIADSIPFKNKKGLHGSFTIRTM